MEIRTSSGRASPSGKVFVLSLEGIPRDFLVRHRTDGLLPQLGRLTEGAEILAMETVRPAVSLVAWASYMTGVNPGRHGIYGFLDRQPGSYELFVPNGRNVPLPALWEVLSRGGKRVVVLNVPCTYPPRPVNGILVSCFLSPSLEEAAYPADVARLLKGVNYRLDVDGRLGRTDRGAFLADLDVTLRKKFEVAFGLVEKEQWDFFHFHVMETDRVNHLLWGEYEIPGSAGHDAFCSFYRTLDDLVGELAARLPRHCDLVLLSDHGFCRLKHEVYLNRYLEERDWLGFARRKPRRLPDMLTESRAYSLLPGRVYMNLRGREPRGSIAGSDDYHGYREGLAADLLNLRDPESGEPVADEVYRGEEVLRNSGWGKFPVPASEKASAPFDLLVVPRDGYDLKGHLDRPSVFGKDLMTGTHSAGGAFLCLRGRTVSKESPHLLDLFPTVLEMMGFRPEEGLDGASLLG